jgi:hypothetical protein
MTSLTLYFLDVTSGELFYATQQDLLGQKYFSAPVSKHGTFYISNTNFHTPTSTLTRITTKVRAVTKPWYNNTFPQQLLHSSGSANQQTH